LLPAPKTEGCRQGLPPPRAVSVERVHVLSKKEAAAFGMVVSGTLFLISHPFYALVDSVATHSFTSTRYAMQLNLDNKET